MTREKLHQLLGQYGEAYYNWCTSPAGTSGAPTRKEMKEIEAVLWLSLFKHIGDE